MSSYIVIALSKPCHKAIPWLARSGGRGSLHSQFPPARPERPGAATSAARQSHPGLQRLHQSIEAMVPVAETVKETVEKSQTCMSTYYIENRLVLIHINSKIIPCIDQICGCQWNISSWWLCAFMILHGKLSKCSNHLTSKPRYAHHKKIAKLNWPCVFVQSLQMKFK